MMKQSKKRRQSLKFRSSRSLKSSESNSMASLQIKRNLAMKWFVNSGKTSDPATYECRRDRFLHQLYTSEPPPHR